jgi:hypothetical protein
MSNPQTETFCILPFIHLYSEPKGEMKPCCIAGGFDTPLDLKTLSIDEAFNSPQMKELRKDMLEGKRNKVCDVCYKKEDLNGVSPRSDFNKNSLWEMPVVNEDYSVEPQFQHIDIRFSNLCNFKCRMCNHDFSSNWFEDYEKIAPGYTTGRKKVMKVSDTIVEDLIPHLNNIKSFYFAGGEPLIMPEHYKVLKHLYDTMPVLEKHWGNKRPLSIHYNTNLSVITYDEQSLIDLWDGFDRVFLSISCDGVGEVGEYQRIGFQHDRFVENLKTIQKYFRPESPYMGGMGLQYNFQYTTTIWNVYHIFDFIKFMTENKFIGSSEHIDFYYAWVPNHVALNNISKTEKDKVVKFLEDGMKNITIEKTIGELNNLISFIKSDQNIDNPIETIVGFTKNLDELYQTNANSLNGIDFDSMIVENFPK